MSILPLAPLLRLTKTKLGANFNRSILRSDTVFYILPHHLHSQCLLNIEFILSFEYLRQQNFKPAFLRHKSSNLPFCQCGVQ